MDIEERDPHSGYKTTGHDWNGITELNTPVPRPVYLFLIAAFLVSVVYWILMPAWPTGLSYTKGLLGYDQRTNVEREVTRAEAERAPWMDAIGRTPFEQALADPALMARVRDTGPTLFGDNCAVCHGQNGAGAPGFPSLRDRVWLWGGDGAAIAETMRVGVNAGHAQTRVSQMPAFGRDQMLPAEDIRAVVAYVRSLSQTRAPSATLTRGAAVFASTCASCHGANGEGMQSVGAPALSDAEWLYGGDADTIYRSVWGGRHGEMPAWEGRLSAEQRRLLTLYLLDQNRRPQ
jgi:cytochrome c oxidase cbb3-type subunit 3